MSSYAETPHAASIKATIQRLPRSLKRLRIRKRYAPFLITFCLLLFLQMASLPLNPVFLFLDSHASPMTVHCGNKTCCTPFCYLDENGKHHCVHITQNPRGHEISVSTLQPDSGFLLISSTLPPACSFLPPLVACRWALVPVAFFGSFVTEPPSPPPKVPHIS